MKAVKTLRQHDYQMKLNSNLSAFAGQHPLLALLMAFVLLPILLLLAICAAAYLIALPLGVFLGWF